MAMQRLIKGSPNLPNLSYHRTTLKVSSSQTTHGNVSMKRRRQRHFYVFKQIEVDLPPLTFYFIVREHHSIELQLRLYLQRHTSLFTLALFTLAICVFGFLCQLLQQSWNHLNSYVEMQDVSTH